MEYKDCRWDKIRYEGERLAYSELAKNNMTLPEFNEFHRLHLKISEAYRSKAYDAMIQWRATDALEGLLTELGLDKPGERSRMFIETTYATTRDFMVVLKDSVDTLRQLKFSGYKIGLISNTIFPSYLHEADLESHGLLSYLDFRIYSSDYGVRKPHMDIFKAGIDRMGFSPEEIIHVGDRFRTDVLGSRKAGMEPVLKFCERRDYPDPIPTSVPVIFKISELLELLDMGKRQISA
jgi:HAD superfamily hydrolase (TIGR01549 family)